MNLKTAARRLGVHYQTAYRWVRSGQLVAVKIGPGYEISDAALERFCAQRAAMERLPDLTSLGEAEPEGAGESETALAQLDAMVAQVTVDAGAVLQRGAHLVAEVLGDAVTVSLPGPDGALQWAAYDHRVPERAVEMGAQLRFTTPDAMVQARQAVETGDTVCVPQLPQHEARAMVRPEFHESLTTAGLFSAISAPVEGNGQGRGAVLATRDVPGRPYTDDDRAFVCAVASRLGAAVVRADRGIHAWELRQRLTDELCEHVCNDDIGCAREWLIDEVDDDDAAAVVDLEMKVDGATSAFAAHFGATASECKERPLIELVREAGDLADGFARMRAGEYDFSTMIVNPAIDAATDVVLDAAAVRRPDATPSCVLYVAHRVPEVAAV